MNLQASFRRNVPTAPSRARADRCKPLADRVIHDLRWRAVTAALVALREDGRHAVRIVDADCGAGGFLIHILQHARKLGFKAIEGRGIDSSPMLIGRARAAAKRLADSAIGIEFDVGDIVVALRAEHDFPADIVLWRGSLANLSGPDVLPALRAAGNVVIAGDTHAICGRIAT